MFLRYFSYGVQRDLAISETVKPEGQAILSHVNDKGGIGFYIRIDGPVLRSFHGFGLTPEQWDAIFTHYFELQICKSYLEVINDLCERGAIDESTVNARFVPRVDLLLGTAVEPAKTTEDLLSKITAAIDAVARFRGEIPFKKVTFEPKVGFASQALSFPVVNLAKESIKELDDKVNFVILIDEYENFLPRQQRMVNTLIKFVGSGVTFRIGMRLEGFRTFSTITADDFIMEGRDYRKFVFEDFLIKAKNYERFLSDIAKRRLEAVQVFNEKHAVDINKFLGSKEDLKKEAVNIVSRHRNKRKHFDLLDKKSPESFSLLSHHKNPLLEMLNIVLVNRGGDPKDVNDQMKQYLEGGKGKAARKYRMDYIDKYKLSLLFLLASAYRTNKNYYSFNTFCFLSSGIVGHFIELCRRSFQYAGFEDKERLLDEGSISMELQTKAARDVADAQLQMISRIEDYGDGVNLLAKNLGNVFREYHKDKYLRYPETNQFCVPTVVTNEALKSSEVFKAAIRWSVIQKKPGLQQSSPGEQLTEIYTLNRIFSPIFEISYRTRGGYSVEYTFEEVESLMSKDGARAKLKPRTKGDKAPSGNQRLLPFG
jgi:hypothetical protein